MVDNLSLFDADGERAARDRAMVQVDAHADRDWKDRAYAAIVMAAARLPELISDDIWAQGVEKPVEARALGPLMRRAAKAGILRDTGRTRNSAQVGCHAMPRRIWESLIYDAGDGVRTRPPASGPR